MIMRKTVLALICVLSGLLLAFSGYKVASIVITSANEKRAFLQLASTVEQAANTESANVETAGPDEEAVKTAMSILPEYAGIYEQNSDLYGWICIEDSKINYPVMQTPDDPQFYLSHAFDKSDAKSGTPFLDADCTADGGIFIVYGHQMNNDSMFGTLPEYEDKAYWEEHRSIRFDTLYEHGEYEVIAAFFSRIYTPEQKGFRYYDYTDLSSEVIFNSYVEQVRDSALYDTGLTAQFGDTLLVLSTCSYHTQDGRFVVVAKKN